MYKKWTFMKNYDIHNANNFVRFFFNLLTVSIFKARFFKMRASQINLF